MTGHCPLCGATESRHIKITKYGEYRACEKCQLSFIFSEDHSRVNGERASSSTITDPSYIRELTADWEIRCHQAKVMLPRRLAFYESLLGRPVRRVLEVGCGSGAWGEAYQKAGIHYLGLELDKTLNHFCQSSRILVQNEDISHFHTDVPYDVVFASQVLEHSLHPIAFMKGVHRILCSGGVVHIDIPNDGGLIPSVKKSMQYASVNYGFLQPPHHCMAYKKASIERLFQEVGLWEYLRTHMVGPFHPIFGVIHPRNRYGMVARFCFAFSQMIGMGSYLVTVAKKR
jgi:2-polyprenyl-3-methyl-5-hydroxy-6-metoxy-1,4-benzoquinol methylase